MAGGGGELGTLVLRCVRAQTVVHKDRALGGRAPGGSNDRGMRSITRRSGAIGGDVDRARTGAN